MTEKEEKKLANRQILVKEREGESHEEAVKRLYPDMWEQFGQDLIPLKEIEHAIQKRFRIKLMAKFTKALSNYRLLQAGDKVAVAISGGKDSLLTAKLFQLLHRYSEIPFEVEYLSMDPGYNPINRKLLEFNCAWLGIPVHIFESDVFEVADSISDKPCYLCARMRRGFLYHAAQSLGCNKLALGHHMNDVIETTLLNILWSANFKIMMPRIQSLNFPGIELIRPLYLLEERNIIAWRDFCGLKALDCACTVTQSVEGSQRKQMKQFIKELKKVNTNVEKSIFRSGENVAIDAILGYVFKGEKHSFLEHFGEDSWTLS